MIIVIILISIVYIVMLSIILKAYYRDQEEFEKRCLQLEKRIEEYRKVYNNYYTENKSVLFPAGGTIGNEKNQGIP